MAKVLTMGGEAEQPSVRVVPNLLQREETAAQIVALMQSRFDRPGPEEMKQILKAAEEQVIGLQLQLSPLS